MIIKKVLSMFLVLSFSILLVGFGPERATFTIEVPATYATLNSITNNPVWGDERDFVRIRNTYETSLQSFSDYSNRIELITGEEYEVVIYYENDAAYNYKDVEEAIARDVKLEVQIPTTVYAGEDTALVCLIRSSTASPKEYWDEVIVYTNQPTVGLTYIPNSATIHTFGAVDGDILNDVELLNGGTFLGVDTLDGVITGAQKDPGYVTCRFKVDQPYFMVRQYVRLKGDIEWVSKVDATPGEEIEVKIDYSNVGTMEQKDVVIANTLPKHFTVVDNSERVVNSNVPQGVSISDTFDLNGVNIGNYGPYANASLYYTIKAPTAAQMSDGINNFEPVARAVTQNGILTDSVVISIDNDTYTFTDFLMSDLFTTVVGGVIVTIIATIFAYNYSKRKEKSKGVKKDNGS